MLALVDHLVRRGAASTDLASWRAAALDALHAHVRFDLALFHAGSPRVSLSTAAIRGADPERVLASMRHWDRWAVELERLRTVAIESGGVATDRDVDKPHRVRAAFETAFGARPKVVSIAMVHLLVRGQIIALCALGRRRGGAFDAKDRAVLEAAMPALAIGDALQQRLDHAALAEVPARLECRDQRLTSRQRQIVEHVALGHTNDEIGRALGVSPHTVRNLMARITSRLGASNRADVVRLAVLRPPM